MALVGDDGVAPYLGQRGGLIGLGVEVNHDGGAGGLEFACVAVDEVLQEREALVSQMGALCEYLDRLLEDGGHEETAVHVGNDNGGFAPVDVGVDLETGEVFGLGEVKELEIDRVVDVAEGVDVVEAELHMGAALEWILGFDSVRHIFSLKFKV